MDLQGFYEGLGFWDLGGGVQVQGFGACVRA